MFNGQCTEAPTMTQENADGVDFETTDFYLGCFLKSQGFELSDVRRQNGRSTFVFRDRPERRQMILGFYNNEGTVRPLAFVGVIKDMKALIHNA
jgi:hypothetical protein